MHSWAAANGGDTRKKRHTIICQATVDGRPNDIRSHYFFIFLIIPSRTGLFSRFGSLDIEIDNKFSVERLCHRKSKGKINRFNRQTATTVFGFIFICNENKWISESTWLYFYFFCVHRQLFYRRCTRMRACVCDKIVNLRRRQHRLLIDFSFAYQFHLINGFRTFLLVPLLSMGSSSFQFECDGR